MSVTNSARLILLRTLWTLSIVWRSEENIAPSSSWWTQCSGRLSAYSSGDETDPVSETVRRWAEPFRTDISSLHDCCNKAQAIRRWVFESIGSDVFMWQSRQCISSVSPAYFHSALLSRQYIITSLVFKLRASAVTRNLAGEEIPIYKH
jgi:hypothetical protein